MLAAVTATGHVALGARAASVGLSGQHAEVALLLFLCALVLALSVWRLRYWAFQFTAALLICVAVFSVWLLFPPFGDTADGVGFGWRTVLRSVGLLVLPIVFQVACIAYRRELVRRL